MLREPNPFVTKAPTTDTVCPPAEGCGVLLPWACLLSLTVVQVEAVAVAKHGSLEALEAQKQHRMHGKLRQRIQKRQAAEQEETRQRKHEAQLQATLDKCAASADNQHQEQYGVLGEFMNGGCVHNQEFLPPFRHLFRPWHLLPCGKVVRGSSRSWPSV